MTEARDESAPVTGDAEGVSLRDELALERNRARRVMGWFVTFFVFVILLSVALMLLAGITVLRQTRQVLRTVVSLQDYVSLNSVQIGGMTNRFSDIERTQLSLLSRINALQSEQEQALERIAVETRGHTRWIETKEAADERERQHLNERLLVLGEDTAKAAVVLEKLQRQLESFVSISNVVVVPGGGETQTSSVPQAAAATVPAGSSPASLDVFSAATIDEMFNAVLSEIAVPARDTSVPTTVSVVSFPNGDRYEGEFRNGLMHGWGVYVSKLGDRYEGRFENDIRHGQGTLSTTSGERFTGTYVNGIRHGRGSLTRSDGTRYAGDFRNDLINGRGVMYYPDGSKYAGTFTNGKRHGQGVIRFPNGDVYEGEFREDLRTGKGTYQFADGSRYVGDFVDGVRHGMGHYIYADKAEYIGPFKNGRMNGEGVRVYPDGQRVKGLWRDGEYLRDVQN